MFFTKKNQPVIGLDISDTSIKAIELKKHRDKASIQAIASVSLPDGVISNGEIKNPEEVSNGLKKIIDKPRFGNFDTKEVVVCLPEAKTFLKLLRVEKSPNKLEEIINAEIEKNIPLLVNESYLDWQIIRQDQSAYQILVGVCPKNIVNQYLQVVNDAKLSLVALEIEAIATARSLLVEEAPKFKSNEARSVAVIDLGASNSSMFIYSNNTIAYTLNIPLSGNAVTAEISKSLEINKEQAEKAKIICGLDQEKARGIIYNLLSEMIEKLIEKIKEGMEYYNNYYDQNHTISQIILCGGGAYINGLDKIIKDRLGIDTVLGDALLNLNKDAALASKYFSENHTFKSDADNDGQLSLTQETSLSYATAIGLSLRSLFIDT